MSHFAVAVMLKDKNKLEEILAPYSENLEVPRYIKYTKEQLIEKGKNEIEDYKNSTYAEYISDPIEYERKCNNELHIKYLKEEFPKKLKWTDEEIYQYEIEFYEPEEIGENGEIHSTYNPNSKWDWYEISGRWFNELLVKEDVEYIGGEIGLGAGNLLNKKAPKGYKWTNGAKIKDICFEKMREDTYSAAIRWWELVVEEQPLKEGEKQPLNLYKKEYLIKRYGDKEHYAKIESTFSTFAFVDEEGWHEKGEMLYFGLDTSTKESENIYIEKFQEYIKAEENQDKYLIIVDCHI